MKGVILELLLRLHSVRSVKGTSTFCKELAVNPRKRVRPQPLTVAGEESFTRASVKAMGPMQMGRTLAEKVMALFKYSKAMSWLYKLTVLL